MSTPVPPSPGSSAPQAARVREVLDLALERPAHERRAFVEGICGGDTRLIGEVQSLIDALEAAGDALEPPSSPSSDGRAAAEPLTGLSFGNYRVAERLGEGGMGVVYRAEDTRLGRTVAVKVLPPALARDPHRRARFEQEARLLASLNHPNIAAIHGVEETARGPVLVLEYVPGQTLARRLEDGRLGIDEAIRIAVAIARGLEAAHAAGIVHRDLKPSNIQLMPDGGVKILDFGVAKQAAAGARPRGPDHTAPGVLIGTAAYMSPEQARGSPVDRRTDLWAFGCVLFELLSGRRAFGGDTTSDIVAAVLRGEPDWSCVHADTPAGAMRVLRRCLEKDPERRQRDAGDVAIELIGAGEPPLPGPTPGAGRARRRAPLLLGLAAIATIGAIWVTMVRSSSPSGLTSTPIRFSIELKPEQAVAVASGGALAISPDGRTLVFAGGPPDRRRLYARRLDSPEIVEIAGTEDAGDPCFSPDGRWIAFRAEPRIKRVPAAGGGSEVLASGGFTPLGLAWDDQGVIFAMAGLQRVREDGSIAQLTTIDSAAETQHGHPEPLPGGALLFTSFTIGEGGPSTNIEVQPVGKAPHRTVVADASNPRFMPPDRLVFWQAGALMSARFDPVRLQMLDSPVAVVRPMAGGDLNRPPRFACSRAGVLAVLPGEFRTDLTQLAWRDESGAWTSVARDGPAIDAPRLSPDGSRVSMLMGWRSGDVCVVDLRRSTRLRLTTGDDASHPVWSLDGESLVYARGTIDGRGYLERIVADGSARPETLWEAPGRSGFYATDAVPDGRFLLSFDPEGPAGIDVYLFDPVTREPPKLLFPVAAHRYGARLSPGGELIAYTSEETGTMEVYIHRFPSLEQKVRVSPTGGYRPVWAAGGKQLFFRYLDRVMVVDVTSSVEGELTVSPARTVAADLPDARYDVSPDGKRLLMGRPEGVLGPRLRIDLLVGWNGRP